MKNWRRRLQEPVDGASLAFFRIGFGALIVWQTIRYFRYDWIGWFYAGNPYLLKYYGFSWVHPPAGDGIYLIFGFLFVAAIMVAVGLFYRVAIISLFILYSYIFLLDAARYLNHFYLIILMAFVLSLVPAHQCFSLDAWRKKYAHTSIPRWALLALIALMEVMLIYAGLVKISDDWLSAKPLSFWLSSRTDTPLIGQFLGWESVHYLASYFAIAVHLVGAPLLLIPKTRWIAFLCYAIFHGLNSMFFNIGVFPLLTLLATTLFLSPSWPRRWIRVTGRSKKSQFAVTPGTSATQAVLMGFLVLQIVLPLRHYLYPGDVLWTDEGHRFSWRMKLREKNGIAVFYIRDPSTGQTWTVDNSRYLKPRQIDKVATRPDLALQYAHYLASIWRTEKGVDNPDVRAWNAVELNGRPAALLINPGVNLAEQPWTLRHSNWITLSPELYPVPAD